MRDTDESGTAPAERPSVRLLIEDTRNRELLADWLSESYDIQTSTSADEAFDLCIVDTKSFARYRDQLTDRKEAIHPVFLPVVLVSQDPPSEQLDPGAWTDIDGLYVIDEIVDVPVEKSVLYRRLENLLERRSLSRELSGQLERSRERFRTLFDGTPDPVFVLAADHTVQYVNDAFCQQFGTDRASALGSGVEGLAAFTAATADTIAGHVDRRLDGERTETTTVTYTDAGGDERVAEINVSSLETDGDDDAVVIMRDVTERQWFEDRLHSLHAASRSLFDATSAREVSQRVVETATDVFDIPGVAIYLRTDPDSPLVPVAQSPDTSFMRDELPTIQPDDSSITGHVFATQTSARFDDIHDSEYLETDDTEMRSGIFIPLGEHGILVAGSPAVGAFDERIAQLLALLSGNARTALNRLEREQELSRTDQRFRQIADSVDEVIWMADAETDDMLYLSPGFEELTGRTPASFASGAPSFLDTNTPEDASFFIEATHPDDREAFRAWLDRIGTEDIEQYSTEYRIQRPDGSVRWVEADAYPIHNPDGTVDKYVGLLNDVTERKERERELQRQNERLDQFASLVSHDLRNPIQVSMSRIEAARATGEVEEHLEIAADSLSRMGRLIDDVLTLARQGQSDPEPEAVALRETAQQAWQSVDEPAANLVVDDNATVSADPDLLVQLLENLFRNAVEHGGDSVTVTVGTLPEGFYVADDGSGIPAEDRESVFDSGHTTSDEGTGFGLAIVSQIVEDHGWTITATESQEGGARFEVTGVRPG